MKYFIFRNNTIEQFFGTKDIEYSGYGDISHIPDTAESYIWLYQVPIKFDIELLSDEVGSYIEKIKYVIGQIPSNKQLIVFSLVDLFNIKYYKQDNQLESIIYNYNQELKELSSNTNIKFVELKDFFDEYPKEQWIDWKYYFISQLGINPKLASKFKKWFSRKLEEINLQRRKCLVLDLDNTLWGGILGEDGIDGIKIGGDYPGKAFQYFQEGLVELSKTGIILTVCSKNNEADVLDAWKNNPFIILKDKYISAYRINWNNKADNIIELSKELNIGLDSFVFLDDNPTERELVKQMLPMVEVPDFPEQPYQLPAFFKNIVDAYFSAYTITNEDKAKTQQYKANSERAREVAKFSNFEDYLQSLGINITIEKANEFTIPRIAQMTQKTNQFNLTTHRYTDTDIRSFMENGGLIYTISVSDKFGDSGITGCCILTKDGNAYSFDSLLLSCRILGKNIEFAFVKFILNLIHRQGVFNVYGRYIPTTKNSQVADFFDRLGFSLLQQHSDTEAKEYKIELKQEFNIEPYYNIIQK